MKRIKSVLMLPNIGTGYLYFYIHFITEVCCFYLLTKLINNNPFVWLIPFMYDALAFVPQGIFGFISDKNPKIPMGIIGVIFLITSLIFYEFNINKYLIILILCIGNALIHINGAEITIRSSLGRLSHSAIFVSGGSFGVITGKLFTNLNFLLIIFLVLSTIPGIILAQTYPQKETKNYNYHNPQINKSLIIFLSLIIIIVRGFMGYGLPTSWNKTVIETIMLYCFMGIGKALGGILSDLIGVKKTAFISTIISLPFLIFGDNIMFLSLIGVMFFSMTMSITLGLLVSVLKTSPGLAFGLTTIGLFLGTVPIFFIKITNFYLNISLIIILTFICFLIFNYILKNKEEDP